MFGDVQHDELVRFFRGTGTDIECRTLSQIIAWDDTLMEVCHDYIQWLFPTDEASHFNSDAPLLSEELQRVFSEDAEIRANFKRGLGRFLKFLGLNFLDAAEHGGAMRVAKADNFQRRMRMCWHGPNNHNWRRMSRVLRCLRLIDMRKEQCAFFACLESIILEFPGMIQDDALIHWRNEVECEITPGYASAVLGSPNLLAALCKQYFAKHDVDLSGFIEMGEAVSLVAELHQGLGLPQELLDSREVAASIAQFTHAAALSMEDFSLWFPAQLQRALDRHNEEAQFQAAQDFTRQVSDLEIMDSAYAKALLASPKLLESLCLRFFRKYDVDADGRLDLAEAISLSRALHQGLGMPAETLEEWVLLSSSVDWEDVGLTEEAFPDWFAGALKAAIEKCPERVERSRTLSKISAYS